MLGSARRSSRSALAIIVEQPTGAAPGFQITFSSVFAPLPGGVPARAGAHALLPSATVGALIERLRWTRAAARRARAALGDPTLDVAYWLAGRLRRPRRPPPPGAGAGSVNRDRPRGGASARSCTTRAVPDARTLHEAAAAAALAIENARLEVELRARLEALRASRARLVEAGDAERRRLERDLHDGAQQRLVALMIELQLARSGSSRSGRARELLDSAFANAQAAIDELRDLAAGIHPRALPARPDAAIESLASRAPVPVELDSALDERLPSPVEPPPTSSSPKRSRTSPSTPARPTRGSSVRREDGTR